MNRYILLDLSHNFNRRKIVILGSCRIGAYPINTDITRCTDSNIIISSNRRSTIGDEGRNEHWIPKHKNNNSLILGGKDIYVDRFDNQCVISATKRRFSNLSHYNACGILEHSWTPGSGLNGRMFLRADNGIYLEINGEANRYMDVTTEIIELKKQVKTLSQIVRKLNDKLG